MPKSVDIAHIEHTIEMLPPAEQLKLLEKMVQRLKTLSSDNSSEFQTDMPEVKQIALRGALRQYADPALRQKETNAFAEAMKAKHALR